MKRLEKDSNAIKENIICLKNQVLYGYTDKLSASEYFKNYESQLLELNNQMIALVEKEPTKELVKEKLLKKEYDENMIIYKSKLNKATKTFAKPKMKLIHEAVHISMYLTNIAQQMRELNNFKQTFMSV